MKRGGALVALAGALAVVGFYAAVASGGGGGSNPHNKVTICHATGSKTNPYVVITPDASGVIDGHYAHQDHRDIIPPFDYKDSAGKAHHFPGQNWTAEGQAIFNNGCKPPGTTGTTTGTSPISTVTQTLPATTVVGTAPGGTTTQVQTVTVTKTKVKVVKRKVGILGIVAVHRSPKATG